MTKKKRRAAIIEMARNYECEGDLELDDDKLVKISESDDNGAYVLMWKWISFADTPLDRTTNTCTICSQVVDGDGKAHDCGPIRQKEA